MKCASTVTPRPDPQDASWLLLPSRDQQQGLNWQEEWATVATHTFCALLRIDALCRRNLRRGRLIIGAREYERARMAGNHQPRTSVVNRAEQRRQRGLGDCLLLLQ